MRQTLLAKSVYVATTRIVCKKYTCKVSRRLTKKQQHNADFDAKLQSDILRRLGISTGRADLSSYDHSDEDDDLGITQEDIYLQVATTPRQRVMFAREEHLPPY